jgi:hypothetical protein
LKLYLQLVHPLKCNFAKLYKNIYHFHDTWYNSFISSLILRNRSNHSGASHGVCTPFQIMMSLIIMLKYYNISTSMSINAVHFLT